MGSRFGELYAEGGPVLVALFLVSSVSWALLFLQYLQTQRRSDELFPQTLGVVTCPEHWDRRRFRTRAYPLLQAETQRLRRHMPLIATLAASAPLLGLLGTVLGMTTTLAALAWETAHHTETLARGVSQALITTQTGLVVALPIVLAHRFLRSRIERHISAVKLRLQRAEEGLQPVPAEGRG